MQAKIILNRRVRRGIMIGLIALFFVISPKIIMYTSGYRYNWTLHRIDQTGVISIDALPRDANVYLNGININQTLPVRLANLAPGTYLLSIEKNGYRTWKKEITVESKQSTYIKNITLFKSALPVVVLKDENRHIADIYSSVDGANIMVIYESDKVYSIESFDTRTQTSTPIARYSGDEPMVSWSPFGLFALLLTRNNNHTTAQIYAANSGKLSTSQTLDDGGIDITNFQWSKNNTTPIVYVERDNKIYKLSWTGMDFFQNKPATSLWYVDENEIVWLANSEKQIINENNKPETSFVFSTSQPMGSIIDINKQRVIISTSAGMAVRRFGADSANQDELQTTSYHYNDATKEWLAWSPWELWSIYENGKTVLLNRTSERMVSVLPMDDFGVELIATENSLMSFNPGYYVSLDLFQLPTSQPDARIEKVGVDKVMKKIYFLGTVGQTRGVFALEY